MTSQRASYWILIDIILGPAPYTIEKGKLVHVCGDRVLDLDLTASRLEYTASEISRKYFIYSYDAYVKRSNEKPKVRIAPGYFDALQPRVYFDMPTKYDSQEELTEHLLYCIDIYRSFFQEEED